MPLFNCILWCCNLIKIETLQYNFNSADFFKAVALKSIRQPRPVFNLENMFCQQNGTQPVKIHTHSYFVLFQK